MFDWSMMLLLLYTGNIPSLIHLSWVSLQRKFTHLQRTCLMIVCVRVCVCLNIFSHQSYISFCCSSFGQSCILPLPRCQSVLINIGKKWIFQMFTPDATVQNYIVFCSHFHDDLACLLSTERSRYSIVSLVSSLLVFWLPWWKFMENRQVISLTRIALVIVLCLLKPRLANIYLRKFRLHSHHLLLYSE